MGTRYQVFVSSTFKDLQEERQEVMQALLELDCIPAGMELFPAANEDQWTLIKRVIDDCDYYMVVIGGRYGSLGPDGNSFTEMEYRYALAKNKPVIAFLHKEPGTLQANRTEDSPEGRKKLEEFRKLAEKKLVRYWTSPADLGSVVSRSLVRLIKDNPAVGWVRGDRIPDESTVEEMLRLRKRVEELEEQLHNVSTHAPQGSEQLAQGDDEFRIHFTWADPTDDLFYPGDAYSVSWNTIFAAISPLLMDEARDEVLLSRVTDLVKIYCYQQPYGPMVEDISIRNTDFETLKVQFRALGLIAKSGRPSSKDNSDGWVLTPLGEETMMRLRAIRKS